MKLVSRIIRGCGYLEGYGSHPGTGTLLAFVLLGVAAGAQRGWANALGGGALMLAVFGPMYLYGAYDRAADYDRSTSKALNQ